MSDWYEDMERAEQERDNIEYEMNLAYKQGRNDAFEEIYEEIRGLFEYKVRINNHYFENAETEGYKRDLRLSAGEINACFNMVLNRVLKMKEGAE